jgi:MFS family permease
MRAAGGWWVVAASALGLALSPGTIVFYTLGTLMDPISASTGWTRSDIALAASVFTFALIFAIPAVGALTDRYGVRRVLIPSKILFGIGLVAIGLTSSVTQFHVAFAAIAALAAGANSLTYMRAVCSWFDERRGIAIGLAQSGMGVGLVAMPFLTNGLVERGGWKLAYFGLGALVLLVALPIVVLFVRENPSTASTASRNELNSAPVSAGSSVADALRSRQFWSLCAAFFLLAGAINSVSLHLVPMVESSGLSRKIALLAASVLGGAMMCGRLVTGALVDRYSATYVAAGIFTASSAAIVLLAAGLGVPATMVAATVVGFSAGSDGDLLSYLVSRYFGLRSFATLVGYIFSAYLLGTSLFPWLVGVYVDATQRYSGMMLVCAGLGIASALLMLSLGRLRQPQQAAQIARESGVA